MKTHFRCPKTPHPLQALNPNFRTTDRLCHQDHMSGDTTDVVAEVTCKKCLKILERAKP